MPCCSRAPSRRRAPAAARSRAARSFSALPAAAPAAAGGVSDEAFGALKATLLEFMHERIYPNEVEFLKQCHAQGKGTSEWTHPPLIVDLMREAKAAGLWNLFLPADTAALVGGKYGGGLTNLQYADLCEIMGTSVHAEFAAQATNCTSPDTGNMETIARFGSEAQKRRWLDPLLAGEIRSCFAMTEPDVASFDATNVSVDIRGDGDDYVVNGRKWWITGAGSLHCKVMILMGKTDVDAPPHAQQSMLLVPMDAPGIRLVRPLTVFGDDDAPKGHMEMVFEDLRVPKDSVLWEPGKGFEIAQRRLGPGRIHHCMRAIGQCERALSLMTSRARDIDAARHLVREAAHLMDAKGNTDAHTRQLLSIVKALVPATLQRIADQAMQLHGAAGLCADTPLVHIFAAARILRIADGPDAVHWRKAGQMEFKQQRSSRLAPLGLYTPPRDANEPHFRYTTDAVSPAKQAELDAFEALMRE
ncbi:very-long-chain-acyl-CoA dehydrogenase [Aureococcus anophagefferens]|nr:very-long-chain-acyl-CoA dehydrogenase [Aureococcus anophagefferens]